MDLSRIYREAVRDIQRWIGDDFEPPDLAVTDPEEGASRRQPGEYLITVSPDVADRGTERNLRSMFTAHIQGTLTDTVEREIGAITAGLPDGYDPEPAIRSVAIDDGIIPGALIDHRPGTGELRIASDALQHVDPATGTVEDPLAGALDAAVVHAHHNAPLYDHPGYTMPDPYPMEASGTVDGIDDLAEVFRSARGTFRDDHGIPPEHGMPGISLREQTAGSVDLDAETIRLDPRLLERMNRDRLDLELQEWLKAFYDDGLKEALRNRKPSVRQRYARYDPEMEVRQAYFDDFTDAAAKHSHEDHLIRFDRSKMRYFDPMLQVFRDHGARSTGDHELAHELDFANNPVTRQYWSKRPTFDGKYKEDYRNAVVEAITTFEQYVSGGRQDAAAVDAVEDPWEAPFFLHGLLAIGDRDDPAEAEYDPAGVTNPYEFGLYTALSVKDGFEHRYDEDDALELTRDLLYTVTTTPRGLTGVVERSFDMRPVPNYPRTLRVYDRMARDADDPEQLLATAAGNIADDITSLGGGSGLDDADEDRALELFYEGKAVLRSYGRRVGGFGDAPEPMDRLDAGVTELQQRYG